MWCWWTEPLLPLVAALAPNLVPMEDWQAELAAGRYVEAGRSLALLPAPTDAAALGDGLRALLALDLASLRLIGRGYGRGPSAELRGLLDDLVAAAKGDPLAIGHRLAPLVEDPRRRDLVLGAVGRGALQMCRCGDPRGAALLERIEALHPGTDWALANLGNGYRFLGRYADARSCYERLMEAYGRQAWALNFLAFAHQAEGRYDEALALYLEGADAGAPGTAMDRNNCKSNAAVLLDRMGGEGRRRRAVRLLAEVVAEDPEAVRAPWHLDRLRRRLAGTLQER